MVLIDSNIIIYMHGRGTDGEIASAFVDKRIVGASAISRVEALGFEGITPEELIALTAFLALVKTFAVDDPVIDLAATLRRRRKKLKLGDAIIAATAVVHDLTLATRNTSDFEWIPALKLIDPYALR